MSLKGKRTLKKFNWKRGIIVGASALALLGYGKLQSHNVNNLNHINITANADTNNNDSDGETTTESTDSDGNRVIVNSDNEGHATTTTIYPNGKRTTVNGSDDDETYNSNEHTIKQPKAISSNNSQSSVNSGINNASSIPSKAQKLHDKILFRAAIKQLDADARGTGKYVGHHSDIYKSLKMNPTISANKIQKYVNEADQYGGFTGSLEGDTSTAKLDINHGVAPDPDSDDDIEANAKDMLWIAKGGGESLRDVTGNDYLFDPKHGYTVPRSEREPEFHLIHHRSTRKHNHRMNRRHVRYLKHSRRHIFNNRRNRLNKRNNRHIRRTARKRKVYKHRRRSRRMNRKHYHLRKHRSNKRRRR